MSSWYLGLLLACAIINAGDCSGSSSSGNTYTAPQCAPKGFYCPETSICLPRTERCTGNIDATATGSDRCKQKNYQKCDYLSGSKQFQAELCSTPLKSRSKRRSLWECLRLKREHRFVTYRGLVYEFGNYGTRIQDPLDPNYEYRPGGRSMKCSPAGQSSTCTYEDLERYYVPWNKYKLCQYNCQDFAAGLINYIKRGCRESDLPSNGRKRQEESDLEFARYIYNLAGNNCTMPANQALTQAATQQTTTNAASQSIVSITVTFVVLTITLLIL